MRKEYRALIEAEICAEGKLRELAVRKQEAEKTLAAINQAAAYQEQGLAETRKRLTRIEDRAEGLYVAIAGAAGVVDEWRKSALASAERHPAESLDRRFFEYGGMCYFNCLVKLKELKVDAFPEP